MYLTESFLKKPGYGGVVLVGADEARHNLATRVMSNGVEVIVASDKTTLPGDPDIKHVMPTTLFKSVTLSPSTLINNMKMQIPQENVVSNDNNDGDLKSKIVTRTLDIDSATSNESIDCTTMGVIRTYFITYTNYNTMLINGKTTVMTNISTSSDTETDNLYIRSKKTKTLDPINVTNLYEEYKDILNKIIPTKVETVMKTATATIKDIKNDLSLQPSLNEIIVTSTFSSISTPVVEHLKTATKVKATKSKRIKTTKSKFHNDKTFDDIQEKVVNIDNNGQNYPDKHLKIESSNFDNLAKIGSFSLQSLKVLNPVLNIMTGIIKNNLRKQDNVKGFKKVVPKPEKVPIHIKSNDKMKVQTQYQPQSQSQPQTPVYIPVHSLDNEAEGSQISEAKRKLKNAADNDSSANPMMNFDILISPGEVISANPDLIIGRPGRNRPQPPRKSYQKNIPLINVKHPLPYRPSSNNIFDDCRNGNANECSSHRFDKPEHLSNHPPIFKWKRPFIQNIPLYQNTLPPPRPKYTGAVFDIKPNHLTTTNPNQYNQNFIIINNNNNNSKYNVYKTGQYFDDPSPYQDEKVIPIVSDLNIKKESLADPKFSQTYSLNKVVGGVVNFGNPNSRPLQSNVKKQIFIQNIDNRPQSLPNYNYQTIDNTDEKLLEYLTPPINEPVEDSKKAATSKVDDFSIHDEIGEQTKDFIVNTTATNEIVQKPEVVFGSHLKTITMDLINDKSTVEMINGLQNPNTPKSITENQTLSPISDHKNQPRVVVTPRRKILTIRKRPVYIPVAKLTTLKPIQFTTAIQTTTSTTTAKPLSILSDIRNINVVSTSPQYNDNVSIETSTFWTTSKPQITWFKPNYTINSANINEYGVPTEPNNFIKEEEDAESNENSVIVVSPTKHLSFESTSTSKSGDTFDKATPTSVVYKTKVIQLPKETLMLTTTSYVTQYLTTTKIVTMTTISEVLKSYGSPPSTVTSVVTKTELKTVVDTVTTTYTIIEPTTVTKTDVTTTTVSATVTPHSPILITADNNVEWEEPEIYGNVFKHDIPESEDIREDGRKNIDNDNDNDNESLYVVVNSNNSSNGVLEGKESPIENNKKILLGGILTAYRPSEAVNISVSSMKICTPECNPMKNEVCVEDKCLCRNGFSRMFREQACKQLYTYSMQLHLDRFDDDTFDNNTKKDSKLHTIIFDAVNRMLQQSDLRDLYHGIGLEDVQFTNQNGLSSSIYTQFTDNIDDNRLRDVLEKHIRSNNDSIGKTKLKARKRTIDIRDFNECAQHEFNDCSHESYCLNTKGSYTCSCREGYNDVSDNKLYGGRKCTVDQSGCKKCNFHGNCFSQTDNEVTCECFAWYTGYYCHINLKIVLIGLLFMSSSFLILAAVCVCLSCKQNGNIRSRPHSGINFIMNPYQRRTIEKRAMILDTCSEYSQTDTLPSSKKFGKKAAKKPNKCKKDEIYNNSSYYDERDRSLTVVIPRVKCQPLMSSNMATFDDKNKRLASVSSNETKLLTYLDSGPRNPKKEKKGQIEDQHVHNAGALISAGFEVSATVCANHFDTLEQDRSANTTLVHKISADMLTCSIEPQSNFSTFRKSNRNEARCSVSNWINPEDEGDTDDNLTSSCGMHNYNDAISSVAERELGSTFMLTQRDQYGKQV